MKGSLDDRYAQRNSGLVASSILPGFSGRRKTKAITHHEAFRGSKSLTLLLVPEVVDAFRATGKGWQTRVDEVLKDWIEHHRAA